MASFNQNLALVADKSCLRWNPDGSYTVEIMLSDATRVRSQQRIRISADGTAVIDEVSGANLGGLGAYPTFTHLDIRPGDRLVRWTGSRRNT